MKSKYAEKVAYSSQQVDDAVYDHALKFENGDIFHQTKTAHKETSVISSANVNKSFNIWLPFHFLPFGDEKNSLENFVTRPESPTINLLKKEVIDAGDKDYALHWLGIFLHLYADSYSHQQFKGFHILDRLKIKENSNMQIT